MKNDRDEIQDRAMEIRSGHGRKQPNKTFIYQSVIPIKSEDVKVNPQDVENPWNCFRVKIIKLMGPEKERRSRGPGLNIVKGIVQKLNGKIVSTSVKSKVTLLPIILSN